MIHTIQVSTLTKTSLQGPPPPPVLLESLAPSPQPPGASSYDTGLGAQQFPASSAASMQGHNDASSQTGGALRRVCAQSVFGPEPIAHPVCSLHWPKQHLVMWHLVIRHSRLLLRANLALVLLLF